MSPEILGVIGLAVLLVLLFAGMWIGAAMAVVGFLGYAIIIGLGPAFGMVSQIPFTTMAWYPLTCVPLFIFMGVIIFQSGVGKDLYTTAYTLVGQLRGGLAMATVIACALFAAITGVSSPALATTSTSISTDCGEGFRNSISSREPVLPKSSPSSPGMSISSGP